MRVEVRILLDIRFARQITGTPLRLNTPVANPLLFASRWRLSAVCIVALAALMFSKPAWVLDASRAIKEFHHTRRIGNDGAPAQITPAVTARDMSFTTKKMG